MEGATNSEAALCVLTRLTFRAPLRCASFWSAHTASATMSEKLDEPTTPAPVVTWRPRPPPSEREPPSHMKPPSPTRSFLLRSEHSKNRQWGAMVVTPSWEFDKPPPGSPRGGYKKEDWTRLSTPRAGYSRDEALGPAKKVDAAVWERDQYLRKVGYKDSPRELLHKRFHGTSAEAQREQNSTRAALQSRADLDLSVEQQRALLRNCFRTGRPVPEYLLRKLPKPAAAEDTT